MLKLEIKGPELFDEETNEFFTETELVLEMEHSLVSLSKWESKWKKPFLSSTDKTQDEIYDYIRCMMLDDYPPDVLLKLNNDHVKQITDYINDTMTATTIAESSRAGSREVITSELIYYWMIQGNVPVEFETWHLARLFMLIRVISEKNAPPKKMSKREILSRNRDLNAQRLKQLGTRG